MLPKKSLAVPYGNLATMYEQLGSTDDAAKYASLAKSVGGAPAPTAAPTTRSATGRRTPTMIAGQRRMNPPPVAQQTASDQKAKPTAVRTAQRPATTKMN